jgi:hypothetical protein
MGRAAPIYQIPRNVNFSNAAPSGGFFLMGEHNVEISTDEFLLASMRVASLNLRTWSAEIDSIGVALKSGQISTAGACEWLADLGLLDHLPNRRAP